MLRQATKYYYIWKKQSVNKTNKQMTAQNAKKKSSGDLDALIFIDTNVLLDFYRNRNDDVRMQYLDEILAHKELIITSFQVEMEFKKNRQSALGESYALFSKNSTINLTVPRLINDHAEAKNITTAKESLAGHKKLLEEYFKSIIVNPFENDIVYAKLEELFQYKSAYNLKAGGELQVDVISKARSRFELGCPPRKDKDNSIGDAVNWEWILECARSSGKSIIIVSRDGDYGYDLDGTPLLNDYLMAEFQENTKKGKIILTKRLAAAFSLVKIPVTEQMVKDEEEVISQRDWSQFYANKRLQEAIDSLRSAVTIEHLNPLGKYSDIIEGLKSPVLPKEVLERFNAYVSLPEFNQLYTGFKNVDEIQKNQKKD